MLSLEMSLFIVILSFALAVFLFVYKAGTNDFYKSKVKLGGEKHRVSYLVYKVLGNIFIFLVINRYIEERLSEYAGVEELHSHKKIAINTSLVMIVVDLIMFLIFFSFTNSLVLTFLFIISVVFVDKKLIDFVVEKQRTAFLSSLVDFLDIYRNKYFECGNIPDEALIISLQSLDDKKYESFIVEIERVYDVVSSPDSEVLLTEYYQASKNNYLKLFAGLIHLTMENGDALTRDGFAFSNSIAWLSSEIKEEILMRDKLSFSLKSLNAIAVLPVFLITPIKNWASANFYPLERYYSSELGFYTEFFLASLILISYLFLSKIQEYSSEYEYGKDNLMKYINNRYISAVTKYVAPIPNSRRYNRIKNLKEHALVGESINTIYLKKLSNMLLFIIIAIILTISSVQIKKHTVLYSPTPPHGYLGGELVGQELEHAIIRTEKDRKVLLSIEEGLGKNEILNMIDREYVVFHEDRDRILKRILAKYKVYQSASVGLFHIVFIYVMAVIGFLMQNLLLRFKRRVIKIDSFGEIVKYQLIILVLMQSNNTEVDDILIWMERFSSLYKEPLNKAIMNYDSGSEAALINLKKASIDDEFKKIVEHMIGAENSISIKDAFSELESEKKYYEEKRHLVYSRMIDRKIGLGKIFGFVPVYSLIVVYFMLPLVYVSINEIQLYFDVLV